MPLSYIDELDSRLNTKPYVLNELSDCVFGGASGDVTTTAHYLLKNTIRPSLLVGLVDKGAVAQAFNLSAGGSGDFSIGGKICTQGNDPLVGHGTVLSLFENVSPKSLMAMEEGEVTGRVAVVRIRHLDVILVEFPATSEERRSLMHFSSRPQTMPS